jgi:uncharacterized membrane protein
MKAEKEDREYLKDEIRKEFQLERMVLFSDAVFAIVITLMAIEIHIPESMRFRTNDELLHELVQLLPNIIAYTASFFYIGYTWYQHLEVFSLLKDYDRGLVIRNLLMLFFIGFFPFGASLISRPNNGMFLMVLIYFLIIILSKGAQLILHHYILVKRPNLRINTDTSDQMMSYKKSCFAIIMLLIMFTLVTGTTLLIEDPELKVIAWWWFFPFPFILKYFQKKIKK